jgi:hypothetical protein
VADWEILLREGMVEIKMEIVASLLTMAIISFIVYYGFKKDDKDAETKLKEKKQKKQEQKFY